MRPRVKVQGRFCYMPMEAEGEDQTMLESLNQNSGRRIRMLIVDDHAAVRAGLKLFLLAFNDLELVGEATNGEEAVQLCTEIQPDVVLMDLLMPRLDGIEAIRIIHQHCPEVQLIALTNFGEEETKLKALEAGASSYLLKNISADLLVEAIRTTYTSGLRATSGLPGVSRACSQPTRLNNSFKPN